MAHFIAFIILLSIFILLHSRQRPGGLRSMPPEGEDPSMKVVPTMFDVRRLIQQGRIEEAKEVYCEIFQTDLKEAEKAVKELERSIHK